MAYSIAEHRHRFAVWAAARAAQRGFTTVENLKTALETTDLRSVVSNSELLQLRASGFKELHHTWCSSICSALIERGIGGVAYGRAAKLVAVYLKAMVLLGEAADTPFAHEMHPPIDRTLLQNLAVSLRIKSPHKAEWRNINWTQLNEPDYYLLADQLRAIVPKGMAFWMLEEFWSPTENEA